MSTKLPPKRLKPGDELTTKYLNAVRDQAVEGSISGLGPGLTGSPSPNGWTIGLGDALGRAGFLAKTDGVISARVGTTLGSGTVFLTTISVLTITVLSDTLDVLNFSSTAGGIPTATYVWVEQDDDGNYFVTAVDCA